MSKSDHTIQRKFRPNFQNANYCLYTCLYTVLGPLVRHYALKYGFHTFPNLLKNLLGRGTWLCIKTIVKGIVSDHWSTAIKTGTIIGFGFKNPANLGLNMRGVSFWNYTKCKLKRRSTAYADNCEGFLFGIILSVN